MLEGILGLAILAADIWAMLDVIQRAPSPGTKVIWIVVVLVFPILGLALWLLMGPRGIRT